MKYPLVALDDLVSVSGGGTPSKSRPEFFTGQIPWVSPKDMKCWEIFDSQDHITQEAIDNSSTKLIGTGAVLVVIRSGILKHSLPVAINRVPVTLNQDMKALVCTDRTIPETPPSPNSTPSPNPCSSTRLSRIASFHQNLWTRSVN